jgi:sugar lactone lactonase YvrE
MQAAKGSFTLFILLLVIAGSEASTQDPSEYKIETIAGTPGVAGYNGDEVGALTALTNQPREVSVAPDGSIVFSDEGNARIRKLRTDGFVETIAGTGIEGYTGDGGPAKVAAISKARGVTVAQDGTVYFADTWNHVLRRISPGGTIDRVCGTGTEGYNGDGLPALDTAIARPNDVALGSDGLLYFCDLKNHRIRRIRSDGRVETVAGSGEESFGGDGGLAIQAALNSPSGIAFGPDGALYIADEDNNRIRRVAGGTIATVVGQGQTGLGADDVPPLQARLDHPRDVAVAPDGTVFLTDTANHRVAMVRPGGNFRILAGSGVAAYSGDGVPAPQALLNEPKGVAVDAKGSVYVCDTVNHVVRRIFVPGSGGETFLRGDADLTGDLAINDPMLILNYLFASGYSLACLDAADADDAGSVNITDAIYILRFLFLGDKAPPAPYPTCGPDSEAPDTLDCAVGDACVL